MASKHVLITGSTDGLGLMAAKLLVADGHHVTLHARNEQRAGDAREALPEADNVLVADLSTLQGMRTLAAAADEAGRYDGVVHNAGLGFREAHTLTDDGLDRLFAVNVVAPYLLTATMARADRLVYLSSGMHRGGDLDFVDLQWERRRWNGSQAYSDSKLLDTVLAFAVARHWPDVCSNAVEPGWVATKMGGPGAPDDFRKGGITQGWLAASDDPAATQSGKLFKYQEVKQAHPSASDEGVQERLLTELEKLTGVAMPD
jgi:NAD(P)-dependent dehydrogenase (short-subunit alcohol dehydrogenase family)